MRFLNLPVKYFLVTLLVFLGIIVVDTITLGQIPVLTNIAGTLVVIIVILVAYTIGISLLVSRIREESSKVTAMRIFMTILLGIGALIALAVWIDDPGQFVISLGIVWGAIFIALRDLIQNVVGSLVVLITGIFRIGDRVRIRNITGIVMDISIFRSTLMELDEEAGEIPTGEIITIPNGILFREIIVNTSRHLSVVTDEIRITVPFNADLEKAKGILAGVVEKHTRDIESQASAEIDLLSKKKYLPAFKVKPKINMLLSDWGIVLIVTYFTTPDKRSGIKNAIIADISGLLPGMTNSGQWDKK